MKDYSNYLKIASYNVQNLMGFTQLDEICAEVSELDPDIIGFQELDVNGPRSKQKDELAELAAKLGYPYYYYSMTCPLQEIGKYGHGILSKFPIVRSESIYYTFQSGEVRNFSRSEIDVNGTLLCFYNTHICLGDDKIRGKQIKEVLKRMKRDKYSVITGDFNSWPEAIKPVMDNENFVALNGGGEYDDYKPTFPMGDNPTSPIDHIIVSKSLDHYWEEDTHTGIIVNHSPWSDHNMIYTYVQFKK